MFHISLNWGALRSLGAILDFFTTELSRLTILSIPLGPRLVLTTSATAILSQQLDEHI